MSDIEDFKTFASRQLGMDVEQWEADVIERAVNRVQTLHTRTRRPDPLMEVWLGWADITRRWAALPAEVRLMVLDPHFHTEDQEDWDDAPELCWRCDATDSTSDVGLCADCLSVLAP